MNKQSIAALWLSVVALAAIILFWPLPESISSQASHTIFWQLRLPKVLTAIIVGGGLAVSAAILQVLLKNPLADPGIIGVTSGASLFAAIYLLVISHQDWSLGIYGLPFMCFMGAFGSALLIHRLSLRFQGDSGSGVILAGIGISTLCGAIIGWLYFVSDAQSMRNLTFWLMGSLEQTNLSLVATISPVSFMILAYVVVNGRKLNWFYLGEISAQIAGVNAKRFFNVWLILSAVLVSVAVSLAGSIAFVGLLVPHFVRRIAGHDNRYVLHGSLLVGAILMLLILVINQLSNSVTLPVSMLTATLGGPAFIYALLRQEKG